MAMIDEVGLDIADEFGIGDTFGSLKSWFRELTAIRAWQWYDENRNEPLVTVGIWILRYHVKVRHVKPLFVKLFGERPLAI